MKFNPSETSHDEETMEQDEQEEEELENTEPRPHNNNNNPHVSKHSHTLQTGICMHTKNQVMVTQLEWLK